METISDEIRAGVGSVEDLAFMAGGRRGEKNGEPHDAEWEVRR
jgi:hypothetical protein